jgi:hypothetical protein
MRAAAEAAVEAGDALLDPSAGAIVSLKRERVNRRSWPTRREAIFEWIEGWYNPRPLRSTLG